MHATVTADRISPRWTVLIISSAQMLVILDGSIVNVALATMQSSLGFSQEGLAWVINAYVIGFGGFLLLAGRLGDLFGRKRIFLAGLGLFLLASILCALARTPEMLVAARFLQGVGGAGITGVALAMIVTACRNAEETGKAIGTYSFAQAAGGSIGLLLGGLLSQAFSWQWIFWVNLPLGALVAAFAWRVLEPDESAPKGGSADSLGAAIITAALLLIVYAIVSGGEGELRTLPTFGGLAAGLVLIGAFIWREATTPNPLVPLSVFRSPVMVFANLVMALMVAAMFGFQFTEALFLQKVLGWEPMRTGLAILPVALAIAAFSLFITPSLIKKWGPRPVLALGLGLITTGLALLSRASLGSTYSTDLLPAMLLLGSGCGLAMPGVATIAMTSLPAEHSGLASGLFNTAQQIGAAVGLAVLSALAAARTTTLWETSQNQVLSLSGGYQFSFLISAGVTILALAITLSFLRKAQQSTKGGV